MEAEAEAEADEGVRTKAGVRECDLRTVDDVGRVPRARVGGFTADT